MDRLLYEERNFQVDTHTKCSCISCYCIAANICGHQFVTYFSAASIIGVNDGVKQVSVKYRYICNRLHGVTSQTTITFIVTARKKFGLVEIILLDRNALPKPGRFWYHEDGGRWFCGNVINYWAAKLHNQEHNKLDSFDEQL